jgi:hypothetical protein
VDQQYQVRVLMVVAEFIHHQITLRVAEAEKVL